MLKAADPDIHHFSHIYIWSSKKTLEKIQDNPWITKISHPFLDRSLPFRIYFQKKLLSSEARKLNCSILFVPGGTFSGSFRPFVTMSQNMLPFEFREMRRFGFSSTFLRYCILRITQRKTFINADGLIFLTKYAKKKVLDTNIKKNIPYMIIPHGIDKRFLCAPDSSKKTREYTNKNPFRIIYVSIINLYKHQWHVVKAIALLRKKGFPVELTLIGPAYLPALNKLNKTLKKIENYDKFIKYLGPKPYDELHNYYRTADLFLFASSCENLPIILLEGMASGLPIACSNIEPMPEILGDAGLYYNPENSNEIAETIMKYINSPKMSIEMGKRAYKKATFYTWERCAYDTFNFINKIAATVKNE